MTFSAAQDIVYDWVMLVFPTIICVWEDEDRKESEISFPYISLSIKDLSVKGNDYVARPNSSGESKITGNREAFLIVNYYGIITSEPVGELSKLVTSLNKESIKSFLRISKLVVVRDDPVKNMPKILTDKNEKRAQTSFILRWAESYTDQVGFIETVDIEYGITL